MSGLIFNATKLKHTPSPGKLLPVHPQLSSLLQIPQAIVQLQFTQLNFQLPYPILLQFWHFDLVQFLDALGTLLLQVDVFRRLHGLQVASSVIKLRY